MVGAERRGDVQDVRLGARRLEVEAVGVVDRHAVLGGDAQPHAGEAGDGVAGVFADVHRFVFPFPRAAPSPRDAAKDSRNPGGFPPFVRDLGCIAGAFVAEFRLVRARVRTGGRPPPAARGRTKQGQP